MIRKFLAFALALGAFLAPAFAAPLTSAKTTYVDSALYADRAGFVPGEPTWFAIRQDVRDGWHVFWVNPGDAGLPLALNWSLPDGYDVGAIEHPAPDYIPVGPLASYAHEGAPVFLTSVTAPADATVGETIDVSISASWQACEDICVPEETLFRFSLPVLDAADAPVSENGLLFVAARLEHPEPLTLPATFARSGESYELSIADWDGEALDVFFFPEDEGLTSPAATQTAEISDGALTIAMTPGWIDGPPGEKVRGVLRVGTDANARGYAIESEIAPGARVPPPAVVNAAPTANIGLMLAFAFFGGLILNAMPCVFPILFVKAASLLSSAQHDAKITRRHGLLYGAGVVASFAAIGALLIALRAAGEQLGWGFHLQSPVVIGLSAYILFAVGFNLIGVFSIGESVTGVGEGLARAPGAMGAFFTGVLAVAVAAPCIGPLLAAPMGAAMTQTAPVSMLIFIVMALGLAAPFVAITFAPGLGRRLPKPGPWMAVFKQALAFPVFAAAAYFVWVFARQTGDASLGGMLGGIVLLAFGAWLFGRSSAGTARAFLVRIASAIALALALAPVVTAKTADIARTTETYGALKVEAFDEAAIASYRAAGRPVFAIFTADWCVTCQADKLTIFSSDKVADAIDDANGVVMVADWTLRDPEITEALGKLGAFGVPFYAVYWPDGTATALAPPVSKREIIETVGKARQ